MPLSQSTAGMMAQPKKDAGMASMLRPPPAQREGLGAQSLAGVMAALNYTGVGAMLKPPPAPAAPAVAAQEVAAGEGAGEESRAGGQLAQLGEDKPPQTEGQAAGNTMTDAEYASAHVMSWHCSSPLHVQHVNLVL